jgi:phosphoglycolate phosphatase-like HAD superfamily hydrolase
MPERFFEELHKQNSQYPGRIETHRRVAIESALEGPNGEHAQLSVALDENGVASRVNFWDLDKTLLRAEPIHAAAVVEIFLAVPDVEELRSVYFAGFKLGNSFREWDRMHRIYTDGQEQFKDPQIYYDEVVGVDEERRKVDEDGHLAHQRANDTLQEYGKIAYQLMAERRARESADGTPSFFESSEFQLEAPVHLLKAKFRMGEVHVFMTANQQDFARALVAFSGLYKYGMFLATDETMVGGGKDIAILKLIAEIEAKEIKVPRNDKGRLVVYGDSATGDIGSASKFTGQHPEYQFSGGLVTDTIEGVEQWKNKLHAEQDLPENKRQLDGIFKSVDTTTLPNEDIPLSGRGIHKLGKRRSQT